MKVYCRNCKWYGNGIFYSCHYIGAPVDDWYSPASENLDFAQARERNANQDCPLYKKAWYKF